MDHRFKSKWESNFIFDEKDSDHNHHTSYQVGLLPWPQRNFMCSFCNKEYNSAQALGGHMNVHRRERARLRLSSPPSSSLDDHHHPNPNPNPIIYDQSPPSPVIHCLPNYKTYHSPILPLALSTNVEDEAHKFMFARSARDFIGCIEEGNEIRVWREKEIFTIDHLVKDGEMEVDLDLELRLGRS